MSLQSLSSFSFSAINLNIKNSSISIGTTIPDFPINLIASSKTTYVTLKWEPGYDGGSAITSYRVEYSTDNLTWTTFADILLVSYCSISALTSSTLYYFRVSSVNSIGRSPYATITQTTLAGTIISSRMFYYDLEQDPPKNLVNNLNTLRSSVPFVSDPSFGRINFDNTIANEDLSMNGFYSGNCIRSNGSFAWISAISGRNGIFYYYDTIFNTSTTTSISFWYFPSNSNPLASCILSVGDVGITDNLSTYFISDTNNQHISFCAGPFKPIIINQWNHIVGTIKRNTTSRTEMNLYVNNSQVITNGTMSYSSITSTETTRYNGIYVGGTGNAGYPTCYGYVNDVKIYNKALTASEVSLIYNGTDDFVFDSLDIKSLNVLKGLTSLYVVWDTIGVASSYTLRYKRVVDSTYTTITNITNKFYSISSLSQDTQYDIGISAIDVITGPERTLTTKTLNQVSSNTVLTDSTLTNCVIKNKRMDVSFSTISPLNVNTYINISDASFAGMYYAKTNNIEIGATSYASSVTKLAHLFYPQNNLTNVNDGLGSTNSYGYRSARPNTANIGGVDYDGTYRIPNTGNADARYNSSYFYNGSQSSIISSNTNVGVVFTKLSSETTSSLTVYGDFVDIITPINMQITGFRYVTAAGAINFQPGLFYILGCNDSSSSFIDFNSQKNIIWDRIYTTTGTGAGAASQLKSYTVSPIPTKTYKNIRFLVNSITSGGAVTALAIQRMNYTFNTFDDVKDL